MRFGAGLEPGRTNQTSNQMAQQSTLPLANYWYPGGNGSENYTLYYTMQRWLTDSGTEYRFGWKDTGQFLPDYLILDDIGATAFKLKFKLC